MPKRLSLKSVARKRLDGTDESLAFSTGVNVIVGEGNTGKTKWLETIDWLLGAELDTETRQGNVLFEKYQSARAVLSIGNQDVEVERRWTEVGALGKVFVAGEPLSLRDYGRFLLEQLQIPIVRFPQGNPYSARKWPELTWRTLLRHVYREETLWSDIADRQPEVDQHACIVQFLGVAEKLFSDDYGDLVSKNKQIFTLQAQREEFMQVLDQISKDVVNIQEVGVSVTPESLAAARNRLKADEEALASKRRDLVRTVRAKAEHEMTVAKTSVPNIDEISSRLVEMQQKRDSVHAAIGRAETRRAEVQATFTLLQDEVGRLDRAIEAGSMLADLKVTHCPACDRALVTSKMQDECYLCRRPLLTDSDITRANRRIDFERQQLNAELEETGDLLQTLQEDRDSLQQEYDELVHRILEEQRALRPIREAVAAVLPPELYFVDVEQGRLIEKLQQVDRIEAVLQRREHLAQEILRIQNELAAIEGSVEQKSGDVDFVSLADQLRDGMITYLNRIHELNPDSWIGGAVTVQLKERSFRFRVGDGSWKTTLGATQRLYFLFAYHYALLNLQAREGTHFPGLLILDFPATVEDRKRIADKENFILQPFVELLAKEEMSGCQLIAAGRSFKDLESVHRIELDHVWKPVVAEE